MGRIASLLPQWPGFGNRHVVDAATSAEQLLQSLFVMAWMVEARDPYTGGHLWRVSQYSRLLAQHAGMSAADAARISIGGFLHDLGKIGVPDAILRKAERLTDEEFTVIKVHPEVGARLLASHPLAALADNAVLHHHERIDGTGYPASLAGDAIPLDARIVSICDAFDAMTSARPYRSSIGRIQALGIIEDQMGRQFDRHFAKYFLNLCRAGVLDHIIGHSDHGIPMQECPVCGPTIVVRRAQHDGDHVYCRNCGNEAIVTHVDGQLSARPTGNKGTISALIADPDLDVIGELVKATTAILYSKGS
jgi:hypothetical protein